ncbi:unnamed protein product [Owenia fusiformis]|nr:unnamed protein product [Owenia fusiformis]
MRTYVCAFIVLCCALGINAGIKSFFKQRGGPAANAKKSRGAPQSDIRDLGIECKATDSSKYRYANASCKYLVCKDTIYELARCEDGKGVTNSFKIADTSNTYPCSRIASECRKTLEEKGLGDRNTQVCGIDLVLIIDMSASIEWIDKVKVRSFVIDMLKNLRLGDAFTLVAGATYGAEVHPMLKFDSYNSGTSIINAVKKMNMKPTKGTATWLALKQAREFLTTENGRRRGKKAFVLVLTDGVSHPHTKSPETIKEAKLLKAKSSYQEGVSPPVVALMSLPNRKEETRTGENGKQLSKDELADLIELKKNEFADIPSPGSQYRYDLETYDDLHTVMNPILRTSCEDM